MGEIVKESSTPQLAIENTHNALTGNDQIHRGVIYETSLGKTLHNLKSNTGFSNIKERDNRDNIWNGFPVEKTGSNKLKIIEKI